MPNPHIFNAILRTDRAGTHVESPAHTDVRMSPLAERLLRMVEDHVPVLELLDLGDQVGGTGYIDFVKPEDMVQAVMCGRDIAGRTFVCFRMETDDGEQAVETVFQRYAGDHNVWTSGGESLLVQSRVDEDTLDRVHRLLHGERVGRVEGAPAFRREQREADDDVHHLSEVEDDWFTYERGNIRLV